MYLSFTSIIIPLKSNDILPYNVQLLKKKKAHKSVWQNIRFNRLSKIYQI